MNWLSVSDIGNSRIVKSMLVWIVVTPIFAKALSSVNSVSFTFLKTDNPIILSLPFSWQVFFFCALSFTVANIIFVSKCPSIIRKYNSYYDFESKDNSLYLLVDYFNEHITENMVDNNLQEIGVIVKKYSPNAQRESVWTNGNISQVNWKDGIESLKYSNVSNKADLFSSLRIVLAKIYPNWAKACLLFYGFGFLCIGIVIAQNVVYVYKQIQF